jgi:hypothetical protein
MSRRGITSSTWLVVLVGIALALGVAGALSFFGYAKRAAPDAHRFAVAPFEIYATGLDAWRLAVAGGVTARLHDMPGWSAVPPALVAERWQGKERPEIAAVEMARRTAAGIAVWGRVDSLGRDSVTVSVLLIDVPTTVVTDDIKLRLPRTAAAVVVDSVAARIAAVIQARKGSP